MIVPLVPAQRELPSHSSGTKGEIVLAHEIFLSRKIPSSLLLLGLPSFSRSTIQAESEGVAILLRELHSYVCAPRGMIQDCGERGRIDQALRMDKDLRTRIGGNVSEWRFNLFIR